MGKLAFLVFLAFTLPAAAQSDMARSRAGMNSSVEGGAALGGTGLDGTADVRRSAERDQAIKGLRLPPERKKDSRDSASVGSSIHGGTDLGLEAEREEAELRRKQRGGSQETK